MVEDGAPNQSVEPDAATTGSGRRATAVGRVIGTEDATPLEFWVAVSPDSFVYLYSSNDVVVVPASSVIGSRRCNPHELYSKTIVGFFINYLECFIGDPRIQIASIDQMEVLLKRYEVPFVSAMVAEESKRDRGPQAPNIYVKPPFFRKE